MTAYQKSWHKEIEDILIELDANNDLYDELMFILSNYKLTEIYPNQVVNALKIAQSIKNGNINTALVAPMQSGKSGTIFVLVNYILPHLSLIENKSSVIFVTSMRDKDLYAQNKRNLERDFYSSISESYKTSKISVIKMDKFFKSPNPFQLIRELGCSLIIRDEDQYGAGLESSFDNAFFKTLREKLPTIKLLSVSATPYDILDAKLQGYDINLIDGIRPEKYFGITEMLEGKLIENYPDDFRSIEMEIVNNCEVYKLNKKIIEYIDYLKSFDDGLGIIRVTNSSKALLLRNEIRSLWEEIECIAIGSDSSCDYKIHDGLEYVKKQVLNQSKKVVVIVVQALTAGKDLRLLKEKVRFGIESRNKQLANGAQGIAGRLCGYHNNRNFKLMASIKLLDHYSKFEMDPEIFSDTNWQNELFEQKVRGLSTHTKLNLTNKRGIFSPVEKVITIKSEDLIQNKSLDIDFINKEDLEKIKSTFKHEYYANEYNSSKFNIPNCTVRVASNYNMKSNRVYKNWNKGIGSDFSNIFFKKYSYRYGILISNFPIHHEDNHVDFCGIKIFVSSEPYYREMETYIVNDSMYTSESIE